MLNTPFPQELQLAIATAYTKLCALYSGDGADCDLLAPIHPNLVEDCLHNTDVAVRSSATAEDLPDASFAGQQETYLNVHGVKQVIDACHKCFASIFTDRAISYRTARGFDHLNVYLSVGVQKMVRSDLAASGVMFSIDPETGFRNAASMGLDRDSALVSHIFDERNEAVMAMVKMAIDTFRANGRKIGICGQAPSDYPEFGRFLVEQGIDSMSLNPDSVIKTRLEIAKVEASM